MEKASRNVLKEQATAAAEKRRNKAEYYSALDATRRRLREGVTDLRTDGRTDGRTDRPTDTPSYRDARTHLKSHMKKKGYGPTDTVKYRVACTRLKMLIGTHSHARR